MIESVLIGVLLLVCGIFFLVYTERRWPIHWDNVIRQRREMVYGRNPPEPRDSRPEPMEAPPIPPRMTTG